MGPTLAPYPREVDLTRVVVPEVTIERGPKLSHHTFVDPRFSLRLRQLREARGMSLRDLARLTYFGKSTLSELENGRRAPSNETAARLDRALEASGELEGLVTAIATSSEGAERIAHAVRRPRLIDGAAAEAWAEVLAAERRLDDEVDAHILIPSVELQRRAISDIAEDARGPYAADLHRVAAEWTLFLGWLNAEARHDAEAVRVLIEAGKQADTLDNGALSAQTENFRGFIERQRRNPRGIARHFLAAYQTPGATTLQQIGDAVQAAQGFALLGDRRTAERLLGEASDLTEAADGEDPPAIAYWLSPAFCRLGIGLAHSALGNKAAAADNLRAGLSGLPAGHQDAEWAAEYHAALADAVR